MASASRKDAVQIPGAGLACEAFLVDPEHARVLAQRDPVIPLDVPVAHLPRIARADWQFTRMHTGRPGTGGKRPRRRHRS